MLCAVYSRPQEENQYSILWFKPLTKKEQIQPMATKKAAKKSAKKASKGGGGGKKAGGSKKSGKKKR